MSKNKKIEVKGTVISIFNTDIDDYISLTDIAKYKNLAHTDAIIQNWLRNRNTIELLGFWEKMYNPNFNPIEFEGFRSQAGLNSFVLSPKRWIQSTNAYRKTSIRLKNNMKKEYRTHKKVVDCKIPSFEIKQQIRKQPIIQAIPN